MLARILAPAVLAPILASVGLSAPQEVDKGIAGTLLVGQVPVIDGETVELAIRIEGAGEVSAGESAELVVCRLDSGFPWNDALTPIPGHKTHVPLNGEAWRLQVPIDRRLGILVHNDERGFDELVIERGSLKEEKNEVVLSLPPRRPSGTLTLDERRCAGAAERPDVSLQLCGPVTGITITSRYRGIRSEIGTVTLAPGRYRAEVVPYQWLMCGVGAPPTAPAVAWSRDVTIASGEECTLTHTYERGHVLHVRLSLADESVATRKDFARTAAYLENDWWDLGLTDEPDQWYATISIRSLDAATMENERHRRLTWGWSGCGVTTERPVVPIGYELYSVPRLAAGEYEFTIAGPRIATRTVTARIPAPDGLDFALDFENPER